jgi:hypothetical protein
VVTLPLFKVQDPETVHVLAPVEFEEAIAAVETTLELGSELTFHVIVGAVAALAIGADNKVDAIIDAATTRITRLGIFMSPPGTSRQH